jgi:ferric iron reductase protein FhuF
MGFRVGEDGRVAEIAFRENRVATLEDDPDAGADGARPVSTSDDLRFELRDSLAWNHAAPLIETLRPFVPVGSRFMWSTTADTCVGFILLIGNRLKLTSDFQAEADKLAALEPLKGKTGSITVEHNGRSIPVLERGCCCFAYHLEQYDYCKTCPHLPREMRIANTRAEMAE